MASTRKFRKIAKKALALHRRYRGKLAIFSKPPFRNKADLSLIYTPGVGAVSSYVAKNPTRARDLTLKGNSIAVVSDGSAVLGLGNIGPEGALPVMEGKCLLFKKFANIDALPIVLRTQDPDEIVAVVKAIAPGFGGINLEDISAPRCFAIEARLKQELDIPVMHDDQHGTAIVVLAAFTNALKVVRKSLPKAKIVINGAGPAGTATAYLLLKAGARNIVVLDSKGILSKGRSHMEQYKRELARRTNPKRLKGKLGEAIQGADVFIGLSRPKALQARHIQMMAEKPIVFALANPIPEIMPDEANNAGAKVIATGRSDFPNQINNSLVFPGVFRGALDHRVRQITDRMKLAAALALARLIKKPTSNQILPSMFDRRVAKAVAAAIRN